MDKSALFITVCISSVHVADCVEYKVAILCVTVSREVTSNLRPLGRMFNPPPTTTEFISAARKNFRTQLTYTLPIRVKDSF